ncbi:OmpA/MotB family protein [Emcibacter nanhaiensis]|uniref:Chemotaxis protein MotB n=1 Tax=Emcibacter nanhaiensis TaxID=1505037 RepID=A0A501PRV0_9PROT|nr:flagellar motor protein MotB [Emcibacter nanhaiensis]TPD62847.1 chemotaxis protein MotB [Emcibacter nanhaiensis]
MSDPALQKSRKTVADSWMIIFADLLALLLTFFVLMFSMNSVQVSKWKAVVEALSEQLNPERAKVDDTDWEKVETALVYREPALSLVYLKRIFEDKLQYDPILQRSSITVLDDRLAISLPSDMIFEQGSSELNKEAHRAMVELGDALRDIPNRIVVVGHTDLEPTSGSRYPSNWELSLVRAATVAKMIEKAGYANTIEAYGNGSSRFHELDENIDLDQRFVLARRVDVMIHKDEKN